MRGGVAASRVTGRTVYLIADALPMRRRFMFLSEIVKRDISFS
ncbi:hypothetical protein PQR67_33355 [Paraburkholderia fungorum]